MFAIQYAAGKAVGRLIVGSRSQGSFSDSPNSSDLSSINVTPGCRGNYCVRTRSRRAIIAEPKPELPLALALALALTAAVASITTFAAACPFVERARRRYGSSLAARSAMVCTGLWGKVGRGKEDDREGWVGWDDGGLHHHHRRTRVE
jgi:hypothetical protein